jgi:hypothetical protein
MTLPQVGHLIRIPVGFESKRFVTELKGGESGSIVTFLEPTTCRCPMILNRFHLPVIQMLLL